MESTELAVIGLTCNLVGVFFLANSIIFRRPRKVMEEFFGVGAGSMVALRDYSLNKMQVAIGVRLLVSEEDRAVAVRLLSKARRDA